MFIRRILDSEKDSSIKIIGIGDVGNNIVIKLKESECKYHTIAINPDMRDAIGIPDTKLIIGLKVNKGLGCRTNLELAKECYEESLNEIKSIIKSNTNTYIIVGSLSSTSFAVGLKYILNIINELDDKKIYIVASDSTNYENETRKNIKELSLTIIKDKQSGIFKYSTLNISKFENCIYDPERYEQLNNEMIRKINEYTNDRYK